MRIFAIIVGILGIVILGATTVIGGAVILLGVGVGILYFVGWPGYQEAKESVRWPRVTGTILSSKVVRNLGQGRGTYSPNISYSYVVDGKKFQSSQIFVGGHFGSGFSHYAHRYVKKYPVGKGVMVRYSLKENSKSALEPGVKIQHYISLGVGGVFVFAGLALFLSTFS